MYDKTEIGLVITHSKGSCRNQDFNLISKKLTFEVLPIRVRICKSIARHAAKVGPRSNASFGQPVGNLLSISLRQRIDDSRSRKRSDMSGESG